MRMHTRNQDKSYVNTCILKPRPNLIVHFAVCVIKQIDVMSVCYIASVKHAHYKQYQEARKYQYCCVKE